MNIFDFEEFDRRLDLYSWIPDGNIYFEFLDTGHGSGREIYSSRC